MSKADQAILEEARKCFALAEEAERENRSEGEDDLHFVAGKQWPEGIKRQRELDQRPCLTVNRMPQFIRQVVNDIRQNRPTVRVRPVDGGADIETAEVLAGMIRHIEHASDADVAYDTAGQNAVSCSIGWIRVVTDYADAQSFDLDIRIDRIRNPFTVYADPASYRADGSDMRWAFVTEQIPREDFKKAWPKAQAASVDLKGIGDAERLWYSENSVRIAEYFKVVKEAKTLVQLVDGTVGLLDDPQIKAALEVLAIAGVDEQTAIVRRREVEQQSVKWYKISGHDVLESGDWPGRWIPLVPVYGDEMDINGKRLLFSLIRFAKDPQRMFNFWRTAATELVALAPKAPFIGTAAQFEGYEDMWSSANVASHPYLIYNPDSQAPGMPQRQPYMGVPAGALQEALSAADDMKATTGIYDASLGSRSNETSGKAILARQREGDVSTFHFIDNLSRAIRHVGRILIDLIPKVYDTERVVRILGEDGKPEDVMLVPGLADVDETVTAELRQKVERIYDVTVGRYDVAVDTGPSYTTRREEAADLILRMIQAAPQVAPVVLDILMRNLDIPGGQEIAERLEKTLPPGMKKDAEPDPQQVAAMQQQQEMMAAEQRVRELEMQNDQADFAKKQLDIEGKHLDNAKKQVDLAQQVGGIEQMVEQAVVRVLAGMAQRQAPMGM